MIRITSTQLHAFQAAGLDRFAARVAEAAPHLGDARTFRAYVDEARQAGIVSERDVAEMAILLASADRAGRPKAVADILVDGRLSAGLKVFQVRHALGGDPT